MEGIRSLTNCVTFRYSVEDEDEGRTKVKTDEGEFRERVDVKVLDNYHSSVTRRSKEEVKYLIFS
jgi:hypothetical protein